MKKKSQEYSQPSEEELAENPNLDPSIFFCEEIHREVLFYFHFPGGHLYFKEIHCKMDLDLKKTPMIKQNNKIIR